jgi:hypothetical protein
VSGIDQANQHPKAFHVAWAINAPPGIGTTGFNGAITFLPRS